MSKEPKKYTEKERAEAIKKMYEFLTNEKNRWVFERGNSIFRTTESQYELFNMMRMFQEFEFEISVLGSWANRHKRAFKEFGPEDYKSVQDLFAVNEIHNS
jgi:hypothetical protein